LVQTICRRTTRTWRHSTTSAARSLDRKARNDTRRHETARGRRVHDPEVAGSNPARVTRETKGQRPDWRVRHPGTRRTSCPTFVQVRPKLSPHPPRRGTSRRTEALPRHDTALRILHLEAFDVGAYPGDAPSHGREAASFESTFALVGLEHDRYQEVTQPPLVVVRAEVRSLDLEHVELWHAQCP
jgi:hypothetical protein